MRKIILSKDNIKALFSNKHVIIEHSLGITMQYLLGAVDFIDDNKTNYAKDLIEKAIGKLYIARIKMKEYNSLNL